MVACVAGYVALHIGQTGGELPHLALEAAAVGGRDGGGAVVKARGRAAAAVMAVEEAPDIGPDMTDIILLELLLLHSKYS